MELLLRLLKPLFLPLLKLDLSPPHLPEGTSLVRSLRPSEPWLAYRYLQTLFGFLNQFIGVGIETKASSASRASSRVSAMTVSDCRDRLTQWSQTTRP